MTHSNYKAISITGISIKYINGYNSLVLRSILITIDFYFFKYHMETKVCSKCWETLWIVKFDLRSPWVRRGVCRSCRWTIKKVRASELSIEWNFIKRCRKRFLAIKDCYNVINDRTIKKRSFWELREKQWGKCALSWYPLKDERGNIVYEIDHIIPLSKWWQHSVTNIRLLNPKIHRALPKNIYPIDPLLKKQKRKEANKRYYENKKQKTHLST